MLSPSEAEKGPFWFPLRNNLQKELQYYYYVHKLSVLAIKWDEDNIEYSCTSGLDTQIKQFVCSLQNMFSHTAPAIVRTAEKIESSLEGKAFCCWCQLPTGEEELCRRCLRVWEGRKPGVVVDSAVSWMKIG